MTHSEYEKMSVAIIEMTGEVGRMSGERDALINEVTFLRSLVQGQVNGVGQKRPRFVERIKK